MIFKFKKYSPAVRPPAQTAATALMCHSGALKPRIPTLGNNWDAETECKLILRPVEGLQAKFDERLGDRFHLLSIFTVDKMCVKIQGAL